MADSNLFQVKMTETQIVNTVIENTIKMLGARGLITNKDVVDKQIEKHKNNHTNNLTFTIDGLTDNKKCILMIVRRKITSNQKTYGISELISDNRNTYKIIVVKEMNNKMMMSMTDDHTEIFFEQNLMINLIDHVLIPKHEMLSDLEAERFYTEFKCTKKQMPKIFTGDPVAKYYNMKPDQICKITRPSEGSGESVFYRLVVRKNVI